VESYLMERVGLKVVMVLRVMLSKVSKLSKEND
jgi:hypothetical protein